MDKLGYVKTFETKIIRVKHKVIFRIGTDVCNLMKMLNEVPGKAEVDEVIVDYEEDKVSIEFHEEKLSQ